MNDEELLRAVAAHARREEDDPKLAVLDRLARGEPVDERELAGIDHAVVAMFRPLDASAEQRIADRIAPPKLAAVRPLRVWAPILAAAAAVLLFFVWPRRSPDALPAYALELSGNVSELRGDPKVVEGSATLNRAANLQMVLRPERAVGKPIAVRAALVRAGVVRPWAPPIQIAEGGAVRIEGPVKSLFPDLDAPWEVVIAACATDALPDSDEALLRASRDGRAGCRVVRALISFTQ